MNQFAPGTFWKTPSGRTLMVREDGRFVAYPSMTLLALKPDLDALTAAQVVIDGQEVS